MKRQKGAALIVVLSLLTVSLMVGLSSIQSSQIDERLAGNYKAATQAQMAAEQAISDGWGHLSGLSVSEFLALQIHSGSSRNDLEDIGWSDFETINTVSEDVCGGDEKCRYVFWEDGVSAKNYIVAKGAVVLGSKPAVLSETFFVHFKLVPRSVFTRGMLSSEEIRVTGNSSVVGNVHSNGNVDISITNKQLDNDGNQVWSLSDGSQYKVEVPLPGPRPASDDMSACDGNDDPNYCYEAYEDNAITDYADKATILSCDVNIDDLVDGAVVYCDGALVVGGGSVDNREVTLVSEGDITMNGATTSSPPGDAEIGLFVVSGGNIEFNGSTDNYGVFWASGSIRQNGGSSLFGSLISGNVIRDNGGVSYTSINNITNENTFSGLSLVDWN